MLYYNSRADHWSSADERCSSLRKQGYAPRLDIIATNVSGAAFLSRRRLLSVASRHLSLGEITAPLHEALPRSVGYGACRRTVTATCHFYQTFVLFSSPVILRTSTARPYDNAAGKSWQSQFMRKARFMPQANHDDLTAELS